jgi:hypothetical protein
MPCCYTELSRKLLQQHSYDSGQPDYPEHAIAERGTSADIRPIIVRIHVNDAYHERGAGVVPQITPEATQA